MRKLMAGLGLAMALGACTPAGPPTVGDAAPAFDLTSVSGDPVALEDFRGKPVLLYFHMAVGWPPCLQQIVDLQNDEGFLALGVPALSIAFDPAEEQAPAAAELGLDESKLLIDADGTVSEDYGVLEWAVATGEPGHTFVLINEAGKVAWLQDFGAEENGGRMYVPMEELVEAIQSALTD